jgi:hypothetical protein
MPAYLNWFGNNWQNIFVTAASNTLTAFENLGRNLRSIWSAVLDFFRTGKFEFNWTPISQGFVNTVGKLPDIAPRVVTDLEKGLQANISSATDALGQSMDEQRAKLTEKFNTDSKVPAGTIVDPADSGGDKKKTTGENKVALAGSQEAASLAFRGLQPTKLESIATEQLKAAKEGNKKLDKLGGGDTSEGVGLE